MAAELLLALPPVSSSLRRNSNVRDRTATPGHFYLLFCVIIGCRDQRRKTYQKQRRRMVNTAEVRDGALTFTKP